MRTRRNFLYLAGVGALATACGTTPRQGDPPPSTVISAGPRPTHKPKLALQQWYRANLTEGVQDAGKLYASRYRTASVDVRWAGEYDANLQNAVPDVFESRVRLDWVRRNQIVALDDVIESAKADYPPAVLSAQMVDGHVYGVPQIADTQVLFYRTSLLQAAGVAPPQSVDELIDAAGKLCRDGVKGFFAGNDGGVAALTGPLLWSAGLDFLRNGQVGFDDPRAAAALVKLRTLNANGSMLLGAPADWTSPNALVDGLCAMQWTFLSNLPRVQTAFGDDFGVLPFPRLDPGGTPSVPVTAYSTLVNAKSAHVPEAKAFAKWLWVDQTNYQLEWATRFDFHLPARLSLMDRAASLSAGPAADAARFVKDFGRLAGGPMWTDAANAALATTVTKIVKENADPVAQTRAAVDVAKAELGRLFG